MSIEPATPATPAIPATSATSANYPIKSNRIQDTTRQYPTTNTYPAQKYLTRLISLSDLWNIFPTGCILFMYAAFLKMCKYEMCKCEMLNMKSANMKHTNMISWKMSEENKKRKEKAQLSWCESNPRSLQHMPHLPPIPSNTIQSI
jgi:hypothetical protein